MPPVRQVWGSLLDLLLPPHCPSCEHEVQTQGSFCPACFAKLNFITDPLCRGCGLPFGSAALAGIAALCPNCLDQKPAWGEARAAFLYGDSAGRLILPFKHAGRQELATVLAAHMARAGRDLLARADLLVPVPLHRARLAERGYNQSALLAKALARRSRLAAVVDGLQRVRRTVSLGTLSAVARAAELSDAIIVRDRRAPVLAGRHVLLIDDVMTSGATASCCARALLAAGCTGVDVLVAARVPDPRTH
jgi:ComF family protein